ncbi:MAG: hypothetical protein LBQ46_04705 [Treponema sp.]|jgi:hypothetical protein|nr:hypothetical protein [Treponema sp.]
MAKKSIGPLVPGIAAAALFLAALAACKPIGFPEEHEYTINAAPVLTGTAVKYGTTPVTVDFTFNTAVTAPALTEQGYPVSAGSGGNTLTVTLDGALPGELVTISFSVARSGEDSVTTPVSRTVRIVSGPFTRPANGTAVYTVGYYDADGAVLLKTIVNGAVTSEMWYFVTDDNWKRIFNAIYSPNAPGTTDAIETGKTTIPYTQAISDAALGLFRIKFGNTPNDDRVEISGTALPTANGADVFNLIVIDVGIPGAANRELPTFYIPYKGLGATDNQGNYGHIRFRVNSGASLVIEADNSLYIGTDDTGGAGNPCPAGYFHWGCVEVMADGELRDGAYEGFPLGSGAVLLCRNNSYLAVGPEHSFEPIDESQNPNNDPTKYVKARDQWYSGWLLGPRRSGVNPRIVWDSGNQSSDYIEVRNLEIAFHAKVTVKKTLGLIYSVWFVGTSTLTIDAAGSDAFMSGPDETKLWGVFANGSNYKFYASANSRIFINSGSTLHKWFLTGGNTGFITADDNTDIITISADSPDNTAPQQYGYGTGIIGWLKWKMGNVSINN